jgi:hypothetical protein
MSNVNNPNRGYMWSCNGCPFFAEDNPCLVCHAKLQYEYDAMSGSEED